MTTVGNLTEYEYDGERHLLGRIQTLDLDIKIRLVPTGNEMPNAPTYDIRAVGKEPEGKLGAAWLKKPKKPESKISEFLSLTLDDPSFPAPINVAAFPKANGEWDISWRRRQSNA